MVDEDDDATLDDDGLTRPQNLTRRDSDTRTSRPRTYSCAPGVLILTATADDGDALARVQDVIARHLERFGAREGMRVRWAAPH